MGSRFWNDLFQSFNLREDVTDSLPDPSDDTAPSAEFLEVMGQAHHENPVKSSIVPLERYLAHCGLMGETAVYGLLKAVMPCPLLPYKKAALAQMAVLKYFARILGNI